MLAVAECARAAIEGCASGGTSVALFVLVILLPVLWCTACSAVDRRVAGGRWELVVMTVEVGAAALYAGLILWILLT
jgi:hypothetical protein